MTKEIFLIGNVVIRRGECSSEISEEEVFFFAPLISIWKKKTKTFPTENTPQPYIMGFKFPGRYEKWRLLERLLYGFCFVPLNELLDSIGQEH